MWWYKEYRRNLACPCFVELIIAAINSTQHVKRGRIYSHNATFLLLIGFVISLLFSVKQTQTFFLNLHQLFTLGDLLLFYILFYFMDSGLLAKFYISSMCLGLRLLEENLIK